MSSGFFSFFFSVKIACRTDVIVLCFAGEREGERERESRATG